VALPENLMQEFSAEHPVGYDPYLNERLKIIKRDGTAIASVIHREWEMPWNDEPLTLLGPWLRYEGPVSLLRIAEVFGVTVNHAEDAVNALIEIDEVVRNIEINDGEIHSPIRQSRTPTPYSPLFIDRQNLDMLLRLSRRKARPEINERPAAVLIPFLSLHQGLTKYNAVFLKKLSACSAPAKLWETEFCTARCAQYSPEMLDLEIQEGHVVWYGTGKERISLCPVDDLDLVYTCPTPKETPLPQEMPLPITDVINEIINTGFLNRTRDFWEIKDQSGLNSKACAEALWQAAWEGRLSSDSFEPIRRGIEYGFVPKNLANSELLIQGQNAVRSMQGGYRNPRRPQIPRALRDRWKGGAPVRGGWFSLAVDEPLAETREMADSTVCDPAVCDPAVFDPAVYDPYDEELRNRDRVRLLLHRWGILCRPLLERESAPFTWSGLLPAMRRMELSGELVAGRFFAGIHSLQFASSAIARELENAESVEGIYWMNAADPASPAGLNIEGLDPRIPARLPSTRLYFRGGQLIAVTNKNGKEVQIFIPPDTTDIAALLELLKIPRTRKVHPEKKLSIETINGAEAAHSEYVQVFKDAGFVCDRGRLFLW
jgi:ATP-dependent Lhr-like helicase